MRSGVDAAVRSSRLLVFACVVFFTTRAVILVFVDPAFTDVKTPYFRYAVTDVDLHRTPYQGELQIEYPPLAWWTVLAPRLLDPRRTDDVRNARQMEPLYRSYRWGFRSLMLACDVVAFLALLSVVRSTAPAAVGWAALTYTLATALLWGVLYDRLDAGLLMLLFLWAFACTRSFEGAGRTIVWSAIAYAMLGLGISFKIVPVICLPALVLADLRGERAIARLAAGSAALVAGVCLPFAIQYAVSGPGVFNLFGLHAGRGIQIEALYSTLMMICSLFGPPVEIGFGAGAYNLLGPLAPLMKSIATAALVAVALGAAAWIWLSRDADRRAGVRASCYVIAASVILSNVLSPQYLVWGLPLVVLLAAEIMADRAEARWLLTALLCAVAGLTTWLFPYNYFFGAIEGASPYGIIPYGLDVPLAPSPVGYAVLGLRNALYLGSVVWVGVVLLAVAIRPPQS